ncbi:hypothetical protein H5410_031897 [Solanum commersonii]|uniref:Uncharacterized protein n=1 Tax=Solanum commersonii TaxID=4109 RepID=A0A9J5YLB4_SOLCO|nr:hypothetical protein H5410_031897 [Solanum commersonii]
MTNQKADLSMKKAFAVMGGMSENEFEDEEAENQSLFEIEQSDKYDFLALVAITEPGELENSCQTQDTILALMAGSEEEEDEKEDKQDQVPAIPPRVVGPVATLLNELSVAKAQNEELRREVLTLQAKLADSQREVSRLKDQLIQQQIANNAHMDHMMQVLASSSTHSHPSFSAH